MFKIESVLMKLYKDYTSEDNISRLREGVMALLYEESITPTELAKKMSIWPTTLNKFIKEEGDVSLLTLMKIDEYVKSFMEKK